MNNVKKNFYNKMFSELIASNQTAKQIDNSSIANYAFNSESLDASSRESAKASYNAVADDIRSILTGLNTDITSGSIYSGDSVFNAEDANGFAKDLDLLSPVTEKAVIGAMLTVKNPRKYASMLAKSFEDASVVPNGVVNVNLESISPSTDTIDSTAFMSELNMNAEAFDGQDLSSVYYTTMALAIPTSKQDEFTDTFFPMILLNPTDAFYEIKIDVDSFAKDFVHMSAKGIRNIAETKPMLKHLMDNELLGENKFKLYPYVGDDYVDEGLLVIDAKHGITVRGEDFNTAPYAIDEDIDIFAISNTKSDAAKGSIPDFTDALDRSMAIKALYLGFGTKKFHKLDLKYMERTNFNIPAEGHNKELRLTFDGVFGLNTKESKDLAGTDPLFGATLAADEYLVSVSISVNGAVRTDEGMIKLTASKPSIVKVIKAADQTVVSKDDAKFKEIKTELDKIKVVGYDLDVSVTNSNFRNRNIRLVTNNERYRYICEFRSGFNIDSPRFNLDGNDNDEAAITVEKQSVAVTSMMEVDAVKVLTDYVDFLADLKVQDALNSTNIKSPSLNVVYPWFEKKELTLKEIVDSLDSTRRREDIANAILNQIIDTVTVMGLESNYTVVYEKLNNTKKKCVAIGTDPYIASYLGRELKQTINASVASNRFNLTHDTDAIIVSTANPKMKGRVVVTYITPDDPNRNTAANLLNFGFCLYSAPFNRQVQVARGNAQYNELHINPRFKYIPVLPIVAEFKIAGIDEAIKKNIGYRKVIA